jgi:hypothetical protein
MAFPLHFEILKNAIGKSERLIGRNQEDPTAHDLINKSLQNIFFFNNLKYQGQ